MFRIFENSAILPMLLLWFPGKRLGHAQTLFSPVRDDPNIAPMGTGEDRKEECSRSLWNISTWVRFDF